MRVGWGEAYLRIATTHSHKHPDWSKFTQISDQNISTTGNWAAFATEEKSKYAALRSCVGGCGTRSLVIKSKLWNVENILRHKSCKTKQRANSLQLCPCKKTALHNSFNESGFRIKFRGCDCRACKADRHLSALGDTCQLTPSLIWQRIYFRAFDFCHIALHW